MITKSTHGIFADIIKKKDNRYRKMISDADIQLKIKCREGLDQFMLPEDVVSEIICKVLAGKIKWDRERTPNVNTFMYWQIKGFVMNLLRKAHNKVDIKFLSHLSSGNHKKSFIKKLKEEEIFEPMGVSLEDSWRYQCYRDFHSKMLELLEDDYEAYFVFEELLQGYENRDAAKNLKIPITQVRRVRKRIEKAMISFRNVAKRRKRR